MSETLLIRGGRILDPVHGIDQVGDVAVENGVITHCGDPVADASGYDRVIDADGLLVTPGMIDMHVHLREPGQEQKETIRSGARAAIAGGFSSVACMANTSPPIDSEAHVRFVIDRAEEAGYANVFPIGAITKGLKGEQIAEMGLMARGGAVAFSDDGMPVMDSAVMRRAMEYSTMLDRVIIDHCEDSCLTCGAIMNEGPMSTKLGLPGWPTAAEDIMVYRNVALAETTGARVHIGQISTKEFFRLVREGKARGINITAEGTPHHLTLTDERLRTYDSNFKMNPPLRSDADVAACVEGLADGTLDCIATDHAPHAPEDKENELGCCANGIIGLETAVAVVFHELVHTGKVPLGRAIDALTAQPARILGLEGRDSLGVGTVADITVIDPNREWTIDPRAFESLSHNCPWTDAPVKGRAVHTVVGGRVFDCTDF
jgi:dihydroorotase